MNGDEGDLRPLSSLAPSVTNVLNNQGEHIWL
ncbi:MAG: hypothetical protein ACI8RN_000375 [Glaciecola sp.]|jgi:hypothetical protein